MRLVFEFGAEILQIPTSQEFLGSNIAQYIASANDPVAVGTQTISDSGLSRAARPRK
jgi:hypothetical protein